MDKKTANKLRAYFKKHTADELWKQYSKRIKKTSPIGIAARDEATKILQTIRTYEYYIQLVRKEAQALVEQKDRELKQALKKIKILEQKVKDLERNQKKAKIERAKDIAKAIDQRIQESNNKRAALARGAKFNEAVGSKTIEGRDPYEEILNRLEKERKLSLTPNQKTSLAMSPEFRNAFYKRFTNKLSNEEMNQIFEQNFGSGVQPFAEYERKDPKTINWVYKPRKK